MSFDPSWKEALTTEFSAPYFQELVDFVKQERAETTVYPPPNQIFTAFEVPLPEVKVVILGQDPYHGPGQAHGLSFSVQPGVTPPPSLKNIYKELQADLGGTSPRHGHLRAWAKQGVLLLNSVLTVRSHQAGSHRDKGWERFTDRVIKTLSDRGQVVFLLWGQYARSKAWLIDSERNAVFEAPHPSPYSASSGFFGSKPFSKANAALKQWGLSEVEWQLPETP